MHNEKNKDLAEAYLQGYSDALKEVDKSITRNPVDTLNNVIHNLHFNSNMIKEQLRSLSSEKEARESVDPLTKMIDELESFLGNVVLIKGGI